MIHLIQRVTLEFCSNLLLSSDSNHTDPSKKAETTLQLGAIGTFLEGFKSYWFSSREAETTLQLGPIGNISRGIQIILILLERSRNHSTIGSHREHFSRDSNHTDSPREKWHHFTIRCHWGHFSRDFIATHSGSLIEYHWTILLVYCPGFNPISTHSWKKYISRGIQNILILLERSRDHFTMRYHWGHFLRDVNMVWFWTSRDVNMVWFWTSREVNMVWFWPSRYVEMVWFCYSRHAEMVWFCWLERRMVCFCKLEKCERLRDFTFIKMVWFGLLERRWYDLGHSRDVCSWWPPSREVIIPWPGYPIHQLFS